ncbi:MAG: hypothetical protein NXI23_04050 [Bacteroidetes bacterium]|jgi:hypothetical protein|nr:hypothetical protein [Bacteroidota bacterium]MDF1863695.1 hypothetical protein [Saprospiraceae bacterium]
MKFKNLLLLLVLTICSFTFLNAQDISEGARSMSQGVNNAYTLDLPDAGDKLVQKLWKDFIKDYKGKVKKVKKSDDWLAEGCKIASINGSQGVNVYSRTEKSGDGSEHMVWFDLGDGNYLSSGKDANKILDSFAHQVKKELVRLELEDEEKHLKQLQGELKKLVRLNENYHKDIEKAEQAIVKAKENIKVNLQEQENSQGLIESQKEAVEAVKKRLSKM